MLDSHQQRGAVRSCLNSIYADRKVSWTCEFLMLLLQGRSGLSKGMMLKTLHQAVADIEQIKADLVNQGKGRPTKHPCLPGAAPQKKKRKAPNMAPWYPLVGRHAQPKQQVDAVSAAEDGNPCF